MDEAKCRRPRGHGACDRLCTTTPFDAFEVGEGPGSRGSPARAGWAGRFAWREPGFRRHEGTQPLLQGGRERGAAYVLAPSTTVADALIAIVRYHVEAEHHSALVVLGDVTVRHPSAGVRDIEQDVHRLAGADEDRVLPDEVRLHDVVAGNDEEASGTVNVKRVRHRMV